MDRLGDQLLSGAGLAADEDAGVGSGHAADQIVDLLHGGGGADERPEAAQLAQLAPQRADLAPQLRARVTLPRAILTRAKSTGFVR